VEAHRIVGATEATLVAISRLLEQQSVPPGLPQSEVLDLDRKRGVLRQCLVELAKDNADPHTGLHTDGCADAGKDSRAFRSRFSTFHTRQTALWADHKLALEAQMNAEAEAAVAATAESVRVEDEIAALEGRLAVLRERQRTLAAARAIQRQHHEEIEEARQQLELLAAANHEWEEYFEASHHQRTVVAVESSEAAISFSTQLAARTAARATVRPRSNPTLSLRQADLDRYVQLVTGQLSVGVSLRDQAKFACAILEEVTRNPGTNGLCCVKTPYSAQVCAMVAAVTAQLHHRLSRVAVLDTSVQRCAPPGLIVSKLNPSALHAAYYCTSIHACAEVHEQSDSCLCAPDVGVSVLRAASLLRDMLVFLGLYSCKMYSHGHGYPQSLMVPLLTQLHLWGRGDRNTSEAVAASTLILHGCRGG